MTDERRIAHRRTEDQCADVIRLRQAVFGNGQKGLVSRVDEAETFLDQIRGVIALARWVGFSQVVIILGLLVMAIKVWK